MKRAAVEDAVERHAVVPARARRGGRPGPRSRGCRRRPARTGSRRCRPSLESNVRMPAARPAATLASAVPRVSWKWYACRSSGMPASAASADQLARPGPARRRRSCRRSRPRRRRARAAARPTSTAACGVDPAGVRAAERGRDVRSAPPAELAAPGRAPARTRRATRRRSSRCCLVVKASVAAVKTAIASAPAASARARPRSFGHEDRVADTRPARQPTRSGRRRRPAGGSRAATRTRSPRSRGGRRRPAAR